MRELLFKEDNPRISTTLNNLALTLRRKNQLVEAEELYRRSLAIRLKTNPQSTAVATALNNLAGLLRAKGDAEEAEAAYVESLNVRRAVQGPDHPNVGITQMNLAEHQAMTDKSEESCLQIEQAMPILEASLPATHWRQAMARSVYGACLTSRGAYAAAEPLLLESLAHIRRERGDESDYARNAAARAVQLYEKWDRPSQREQFESLLASMGGASR